jgi:hypothetical protein
MCLQTVDLPHAQDVPIGASRARGAHKPHGFTGREVSDRMNLAYFRETAQPREMARTLPLVRCSVRQRRFK